MVGLIGSGKSTYAKKLSEQTNAVVIASDDYRKEQFGDESVQGNNSELFNKIHKDIVDSLQMGYNVIFDATNISAKNRVSLLQKINKVNVEKIAIVMATEYQKCLEQNEMRERQVPRHAIKRYREQFQIPIYNEGWDDIQIIYNYNHDNYMWGDLYKKMDGFNQDNPHHTKTLGQHTQDVVDGIVHYDDKILKYSAILHDMAKPLTKVFIDSKGNTSAFAHYYNHAEVGCYESMFYLDNIYFDDFTVKEVILICGIVLYHMRLYNSTEKSKKKLLSLVGENMFDKITKLHMSDKNAK